MRNIYYNIIDYKEIHPIRFWIFILGIIIFLVVLTYIINRLLEHRKKESINIPKENSLNKLENTTDDKIQLNNSNFKKEESNIFKNYRVLLGVIGVQLFIIISIAISLLYSENSTRPENPSISNSKYMFGIDISHYQGKIDWSEMRTSHHPIEYVFIRSTMGVNGKDMHYKRNWKNAKKYNYIRGAYHYYRPNENSTKQFNNFKSVVNLEDGDFVPILDIEKESKYGRKKLLEGVLNWLKLAEEEYGVKPMIYTGLTFYQHVLKGYVDDYPLWIAAYSGKHRLKGVKWNFHQFTEKVSVKGIRTTVDGNDFQGDMNELKEMCR